MANPEFRSDMYVVTKEVLGDDQRIADAARVSTGTDGQEVSEGFINFLMKNRHGSPFEHPVFTFYVECPIFVAREFMRHRIASYNEESGRYKKLEPVFYIPGVSRDLVQVGKPGDYEFEHGSDFQYEEATDALMSSAAFAYANYESMLELGIAREVARMALPLNIYTSFYVTMNARGLMNFLSLRNLTPDTTVPTFPQREIEMVAEKMEAGFKEYLPITYEAFNNNGRIAP